MDLLHRLEKLCAERAALALQNGKKPKPVSFVARRAIEIGLSALEGDLGEMRDFLGDAICREVNQVMAENNDFEPGEFNPFTEIARHLSTPTPEFDFG